MEILNFNVSSASANKFLTEITYNESSTITSISSTSSELDSLDGLDGSCHSDSDTQTNTILSSIEQNQSFDSTNIEYSNNFSYNDLPIFWENTYIYSIIYDVYNIFTS